MIEKVLNQLEPLTTLEKLNIINFLHAHLGEYSDTRENIGYAVDYALDSNPRAGGFILQMTEDDNLAGIAVMNRTGMQGYVPENFLVYLAVHKDYRGKGLAQKMLQRIIQLTNGDIVMHVEKDNPVFELCRKAGFENPYLEMRYHAAQKKPNKSITF